MMDTYTSTYYINKNETHMTLRIQVPIYSISNQQSARARSQEPRRGMGEGGITEVLECT